MTPQCTLYLLFSSKQAVYKKRKFITFFQAFLYESVNHFVIISIKMSKLDVLSFSLHYSLLFVLLKQ